MAGEAGEISGIGVKLTLDSRQYIAGMRAARDETNAFTQAATKAASGMDQMKAGGGRSATTSRAAQNMGVDVTLSVSDAAISALRSKVQRGLQNIPVTITPEFAASGKFSLPAIMGSMLSMQYGVSQTQGRQAALQTIERFAGALPKKAGGGPVPANRPVIVGEHRPEVIVPRTASMIHPSVQSFYRQQELARQRELEIVLVERARQQQHEQRLHAAMRGKHVRGYGGKFGVRPGPSSSAPTEEGWLYHATDDLDAIRGMAPGSRPGLRPMTPSWGGGTTSFWATSPAPNYGGALVRTPFVKPPPGQASAFTTDGTRRYGMRGAPYSEVFESAGVIPRSALQYWGEDERWHGFRRGRIRKAGAGARAYRMTLEQGGGTFPVDPMMAVPGRGHALGISAFLPGAQTYHVPTQDPRSFLSAFMAQKRAGAPYVGTWIDPDTGLINVDPSTVVKYKREADMVLRAGHEKAAYDIGRGETWYASQKNLRANAERLRRIIGLRAMGGLVGMVGGGPIEARLTRRQKAYTSNIREAARNFTPEDIAGGKQWYLDAQEFVDSTAMAHGVPPRIVGGVLAALSAGTEWTGNKTKVLRMLQGRRYDPAFNPHKKAAGILDSFAADPTYDPWSVLGHTPKTGQFYLNVLGDLDALTIDRWAIRTGTRGALDQLGRGPVRTGLEKAYRKVAAEYEMAPAEFQAAAWLFEKAKGKGLRGAAGGLMGRMAAASPASRLRFPQYPTGAEFEAHAGEVFGFTDRPEKAGWVSPTGKYLDFSAGTSSRYLDHWDSVRLFRGMERGPDTYEAMMERGWARLAAFTPSWLGAETMHPFSDAQIRRLAEDAKYMGTPQGLAEWRDYMGGFKSVSADEGRRIPGMLRQLNELIASSRRRAGGGRALEGVYLVGELGKELFVPDSMAHMVPKKVMDQIPRAAGGMQIIGKRRDPDLGGELFFPPEDGVIIPNRLMDQVPHAAEGARDAKGRFVAGNPYRFNDPRRTEAATGRALALPPMGGGSGAAQATAPPMAPTSSPEGRAFAQELMAGFRQREVELFTAGAATSTRTPQGLVAMIMANLGGGQARAQARVREQREAMRGLESATATVVRGRGGIGAGGVALSGEDLLRDYTEQLDKAAGARGAEREEIEKTISAMEAGQPDLEKWRMAHEKNAEAMQKSLPGLRDQLLGLGKVVVGIQAYGMVMQGIGLGMAALTPVVKEGVDQLRGWRSTSEQATSALAKQTTQAEGNTRMVLNQYAASARLSGGLADLVSMGLELPTAVKSGAEAAKVQEDAIKAILGLKAGGAPTGAFGGYGGLFEGSGFATLMGGGPGALEAVAGAFSHLTMPAPATEGVTPPRNAGEAFRLQKRAELMGDEDAAAALGLATARVKKDEALYDEYLANINAASMRGSKEYSDIIGGAIVTWKEVDQATADRLQEMDLPENIKKIAQYGSVAPFVGGRLVTEGNAELAGAVTAAGFSIMPPETWAKEAARVMSVQWEGSGMGSWAMPGGGTLRGAARREMEIGIPFGMWQQITQNPLIDPRAGVSMLGASAGVQAAAQRRLGRAESGQDTIRSIAAQGLEAQRQEISDFFGATSEEVGIFDTATSKAMALSDSIASLTASMLNAQQAADDASYANQIRLAQRALGDAIGMLGQAGGTRLGYLQREQYLVGRASQSLGLASQQLGLTSQRISLVMQDLSLQLQARQIATNLAVAQFQAPGETGEERFARQREAIIRAGIERRQLGLSRQQLGVGRQQFGISEQQMDLARRSFIISGQVWSENARRAAVDARRAISVMQVARNAQLVSVSSQREIAEAQGRMGVWLQRAASVAARAARRNDDMVAAVTSGGISLGQEFNDLAGEINKAMKRLNGEYVPTDMTGASQRQGTGGTGGGGGNATKAAAGYYGTVLGATEMTVGEAGSETVAILRNPRRSTVSTGGGGGSTINISISDVKVRSSEDIERLATLVANKVEQRLGRKGQMLGLRQPAY